MYERHLPALLIINFSFLVLQEERLVTLATIKEEWENCTEEEVKSRLVYY